MAVRRQIIQETQIYHFLPEKLRIGGELVKKGKVSSTKTTVLGNKFPKGGIPVSLLRWPSFSDTIVRKVPLSRGKHWQLQIFGFPR